MGLLTSNTRNINASGTNTIGKCLFLINISMIVDKFLQLFQESNQKPQTYKVHKIK